MSAPPSDSVERDFAELMQRVRSGCPEAAREVVERYGEKIQRFVRRHLSEHLRSQFDSLDFTQDAWASFFQLPAECYTFQTPRELYYFLTRLARHKLIDLYRRRHAQKREGYDTVPLRPQTDDDKGNEPAARQPTPSQIAVAEDQWDHMLQQIPPEVRHTLVMLRQGHSHEEVAACLGVRTSTLQSVLRRLRNKRKMS
jgi:RNA polymerase sigma factor (sigma-70 family)